jgi:hypothetical protein
MMPVSQGTIQRQPLFRGLSEELRLDTAMALPATGAVIQPKLTLGTPGDMYEEEAGRVARQVVDVTFRYFQCVGAPISGDSGRD